MMKILILNALTVNEGQIKAQDVFIEHGKIQRMGADLQHLPADRRIDATGLHLLPGVIDDQVHFREPGLTHKADLFTESRAAVAGGVTSYMEMPNTVPNALTQVLLADKYARASQVSLANYSFFMGVGNDNLEEVLRTNPQNVCGLKIFMGSSTGNMLVDNPSTLEAVFQNAGMLIATHCEDEATVKANTQLYKDKFGDDISPEKHPEIRSAEACLKSSSLAIALAKKHNTRLHILHITTAGEVQIFDNTIPLADKRITAEVCVHHLSFNKDDYAQLGNLIKCNPAIKTATDQDALWKGLLDNHLDIIATDHAPHTWDEKQANYWNAPSGLPLVQHPLLLMLQHSRAGKITLERVVEKMCHAPAICFQVAERGFIREGYWADLVLVDLAGKTEVTKDSLHYKCGWSPLEGSTLPARLTHTIVSGHLAYENGTFHEQKMGERLLFAR
ncbi:MAG: dihydroorotase [Bacteroidetes bacterium]|nr:MAG: dihydroorotase [Bacteroidota bacterium]